MQESINTIKANGLSIIGSFILGMDGERPGAGDRIISFIEDTSIPLAMVNLLQPAPNTRLWERLQQEGRLLLREFQNSKEPDSIGTRQLFITSRPPAQIMAEFHKVWMTIYDPRRYLDRAYRFFLGMRPTRKALAQGRGQKLSRLPAPPARVPLRRKLRDYYIFLVFSWQLGIISDTRWQYWRQFLGMLRRNPSRLKGYLVSCARGEPMFYLRDMLHYCIAMSQRNERF